MPIYFAAARSHAVADGRILPQSVIEILNPSLAGESLASSGGARAVGRPSHTHDGRAEWAKGGAITRRNGGAAMCPRAQRAQRKPAYFGTTAVGILHTMQLFPRRRPPAQQK